MVRVAEGGLGCVPTPGNGDLAMTGPQGGAWKLETDHSPAKEECDVTTTKAMNHNDLAAGVGGGEDSSFLLRISK